MLFKAVNCRVQIRNLERKTNLSADPLANFNPVNIISLGFIKDL